MSSRMEKTDTIISDPCKCGATYSETYWRNTETLDESILLSHGSTSIVGTAAGADNRAVGANIDRLVVTLQEMTHPFAGIEKPAGSEPAG